MWCWIVDCPSGKSLHSPSVNCFISNIGTTVTVLCNNKFKKPTIKVFVVVVV